MTTPFQQALERGDIDAIRRCPKADLHNHGAGSANRAFMQARTGHDFVPVEAPLASMAQMHAFVDAHNAAAYAGLDMPARRLLGFEGAFVQAVVDGVSRVEFGDDVWIIGQGCGDATALHRSLEDLHLRVAPDVEWIPLLGLSRHCSIRALDGWLKPFLETGFYKAIDLSGDELAQPIGNFMPLYRQAKARGLRLKAHAGEWGTADDVWRAVEVLELDEVQHGIAAAQSPAVMRFLADHKIRLNVCPTSNIKLGRVESMAGHPIRKLFDAGVKVTVNSDDALIFGAGVSDEFLSLYRAGVFTAAELDAIRLNGLGD